jgi:hypothetical protein
MFSGGEEEGWRGSAVPADRGLPRLRGGATGKGGSERNGTRAQSNPYTRATEGQDGRDPKRPERGKKKKRSGRVGQRRKLGDDSWVQQLEI